MRKEKVFRLNLQISKNWPILHRFFLSCLQITNNKWKNNKSQITNTMRQVCCCCKTLVFLTRLLNFRLTCKFILGSAIENMYTSQKIKQIGAMLLFYICFANANGFLFAFFSRRNFSIFFPPQKPISVNMLMLNQNNNNNNNNYYYYYHYHYFFARRNYFGFGLKSGHLEFCCDLIWSN